MAEYDTFTREQLLEELCRKEAVNEKFKKKLLQTQEKCANVQPLLNGYKSLDESHKQRVLECETLRSSNSILEKARQDADTCVKEQDRRLEQLAYGLRQATERVQKAEQSSKQAKADSAKSAMVRQDLEKNLDGLKKQLRSLESALTTVKNQQQDDQRVITSLKAQASKPAEARAHAPNGSRQACQGCTIAQQAVEELRQQMALQRSLSLRGRNLAESMPSTQDRSGDTNDDRDVAQLRSELSGMRHQLAESHEQQAKWLSEMQTWRNTFAILGGVMPSAQIQAPQQTASGQRQVSPVAAEGSNIMPRLAFRPDPAEIRRPCQGSSPPNGALAPRESTPQAGSTAGDGEDVGRHDTLGAGSDSMSNVVLHFLRQSCQVPFPGPFQTEVCCLSATAAALCRLTGKSAGLRAQKQWTCLHHALELAISCLGWRWGFEQVTGTLMGQTMRAILPAASVDDTWALFTMGHLLQCMKHAAGVIAQVSCKEQASCYSALKGLAETLRQAAKAYQVEEIIAVPAILSAENCKAAVLPKYKRLGVEVEEI
ncbi:hypothetical protein WJX82_004422 [Trebouxia sp. C0006]